MQETYAVFFDAWANGEDLQDCINLASSENPYGDGSVILNFPLGMKFPFLKNLFHPIDHSNAFHIQVYGYPGIKRTSYDDGY
jgi:hypothetical protein